MKKFFELLLIMVFLLINIPANTLGSSHLDNIKSSIETTSIFIDEECEFESGIYNGVRGWEPQDAESYKKSLRPIALYKGDLVPDKSVAIRIAAIVMESVTEQWNLSMNYLSWYVFFDEQDEIWIVDFVGCGETPEDIALDGGCCVAIRKSSAEVVAIWFR